MNYNFDQIINRQNTNAMSVDGFQEYLFGKDVEIDLPCEQHELLSMWVADMGFETAPEITKALKERIDHGIFGYTQIFDPECKGAFIRWVKNRYGHEFRKDHIVTSPGVIPALYDLIGQLCEPDEKVLTLTPSYGFFKRAADFNKRELIFSDLFYREAQYFIDFEDFKKKAEQEKIRIFILCHPHNPTGRLWTEKELRQLGEICFKNNVIIIADEIHCDLLRKGKQFIPLNKIFPDSDQIISCMAPSKTFNMAGFLFAFIVIPNETWRSQWKDDHLGIENPLSLVAAQTAYSKGQNWLAALTDYLDKNFEYLEDYLKSHLPKAKFMIPDGTYLAWINVQAYFPHNPNLTQFFASKAGVLLEGGDQFVANADGFIRINIACPRATLVEGLGKIKKAIAS